MQTIDQFTPQRALAMGVALSAINPKNLLLTVGAAAAIAQTGIDAGQQAVALAVFVLIGTVGPGLPVVIYFAMGERAARILDELKTWMGANNAAIMAVLCLVIGAKLLGDGISGLREPDRAGSSPRSATYQRDGLRGDLVAGLTVWAVLVPEALAYATIAGVSPVVGLYAAPGALILYAALGSSRHLVTGPMAATAALSAATVGEVGRRQLRRVRRS